MKIPVLALTPNQLQIESQLSEHPASLQLNRASADSGYLT